MIVLDNNVLIDWIADRHPFVEQSGAVLELVASGEIEGAISANSLTDIFYVLRKYHTAEKAKDLIWNLMNLLTVVSVDGNDCMKALELPMDDFEDAVVAVCAEKAEADCIVTRDEAFIKALSPVPVVSPAEYLSARK